MAMRDPIREKRMNLNRWTRRREQVIVRCAVQMLPARSARVFRLAQGGYLVTSTGGVG
jgi:hypothetical protein